MKKDILKYSLLCSIIFFYACHSKDSSLTPNRDETGKLPVDTLKTENYAKLEGQYGSLNEAIYYVFRDWYLWNDYVDKNLNYNSYPSGDSLINKLRYHLDKWSFIADKTQNDNLFTNGQYTGQGLDFYYDSKAYLDSNKIKIRVIFVYPQSPAGQAGMYRGMEIKKVNGYTFSTLINNESLYNNEFSKSTITYSIVDSLGNAKDITLTDGTVTQLTVLHSEIIEEGGKKIGYMVFNSFLGNAEKELTNTFAYFQGQGVNEFILDLRYNGGGLVSLAQKLASQIAGSKVSTNDIFIKESYNKNYSKYNDTLYFTNESSKLDLSRVFIIASPFTASASELVINGLKPHIPVIQIGEKTDGKPVGFFGFTYQDKVFYPVSFSSVNSNNVGGYYDGLSPDVYKIDGTEFNFGDKREYCLKEALYYIQNGHSSGTGETARLSDLGLKLPSKTGFQRLIGAH